MKLWRRFFRRPKAGMPLDERIVRHALHCLERYAEPLTRGGVLCDCGLWITGPDAEVVEAYVEHRRTCKAKLTAN